MPPHAGCGSLKHAVDREGVAYAATASSTSAIARITARQVAAVAVSLTRRDPLFQLHDAESLFVDRLRISCVFFLLIHLQTPQNTFLDLCSAIHLASPRVRRSRYRNC